MGAASGTRRTQPPTRLRRTSASALGNPFRRTSRSAAGGETEAGDAGRSMRSGSRSGQRFRQRRCRWAPAPLRPWGGSVWLLVTPPVLRLDAWSCRPSPFGNPKGGILRVSSVMGFNPASERKAAEADPGPCRELPGPSRPHGSDRELHRECRGRRCGGVHRGCADPRVVLVFRRLHAWTLTDRSRGSQAVGNVLLCQDVSGRVRRCQRHRTPPPTTGRNAPVGACVRGQASGEELAMPQTSRVFPIRR